MNVIAEAPKTAAQRLLLDAVSWQSYVMIGNALQQRPGLRMTYDRGSLEFMTTSPEHEIYKHWLGRLLETVAEEFNLPVAPGGNMTFQREDLARALEADQCYWIAQERPMRGKLTWDPVRDPPPDVAIEIEISRSALNRLSIYAALRVPEVWRFDGEALHVHVLQPDGTYQEVERSPTFPAVPLEEFARFLQPNEAMDYLSVIRDFRVWVRGLVQS